MHSRHSLPADLQTEVPEPLVGTLAAPQPEARIGVLVVDDEHLVRILVQLGLELDSFQVWLASNGTEAIEFYRKHAEEVAVVLLDVRMPGLDGPETLDVLRELDPNVRACFMSGDTGGYRREELLQRGAACVISKPFRLEYLADVLRSIANDIPMGRPLPHQGSQA